MSVTKVTGMMQTSTVGGSIPSASTFVVDTDGDHFSVTGTTGITAMTVAAGRRFTLQFDGAVTLTHGSSLYLPGATNFTTEANDCLSFIATAANTVRCTGYALKDGGSPVAASAGFTHGTEQATTSGTSFTFGSIPSGTSMIVVMLENVSTDQTSVVAVQLGDAGGIETSGYVHCSLRMLTSAAFDSSTSAFVGSDIGLTNNVHGVFVLTLKDPANFTWISTVSYRWGSTEVCFGAGSKSLSAELTQLKVFDTLGGTFDAGSVNIMYQ